MKKTLQFPLIREFARGYLHQDLLPEYGGVMQAANAYLRDLSDHERKQLASEAQRMLSSIHRQSAAELNRQLHTLGSSWTFISTDEFSQVLRLFDRGH